MPYNFHYFRGPNCLYSSNEKLYFITHVPYRTKVILWRIRWEFPQAIAHYVEARYIGGKASIRHCKFIVEFNCLIFGDFSTNKLKPYAN